LADVVFARCTTTTSGIEQTVITDVRAVVVNAENRVGAVIEGSCELAPRVSIEDQSAGDGRQIGAWLFDAVGVYTRRQ
jgi:hypothetical protein